MLLLERPLLLFCLKGFFNIRSKINCVFILSLSLSLSLSLPAFVLFKHQLEMQPQTQQTIFGLHIGKEYEVHIRCRMQAFTKFGEFSDSLFIQVPSKGERRKSDIWSKKIKK